MREFERKAPSPDVVARKVSQVVRSKAPPLHNPVTFEAQLFPRLRTWFPRALFEFGLRTSFHLDDRNVDGFVGEPTERGRGHDVEVRRVDTDRLLDERAIRRNHGDAARDQCGDARTGAGERAAKTRA